jgi:6,7-dimethyl-8-ribityllumazine synthase
MMQRRAFAVVSSQYNPTYVTGLLDNFRTELDAIAPTVGVSFYEVPGAFEIPIVVKRLAAQGGLDAIVAFGVIIEGSTRHADLIGRAVTDGLMRCALDHEVPVIHEVLVVENEGQAKERCLGTELNRGVEAARAAVRVVQTLGEVRNR